MTPLQRLGLPIFLLHLLDILKLMYMYRFLSPLEDVVSCPFPQTANQLIAHFLRMPCSRDSLFQALLKLLLLLLLLELLSPLPLIIQPLLPAPLVPRDLLDLFSQE